MFVYFVLWLVSVPVKNITIVEAVRSSELRGHSFVLPPIMEGNSLTATCIAIGGETRIFHSQFHKSHQHQIVIRELQRDERYGWPFLQTARDGHHGRIARMYFKRFSQKR